MRNEKEFCRRCGDVRPVVVDVQNSYRTVRCADCQHVHRTEQVEQADDAPASVPAVVAFVDANPPVAPITLIEEPPAAPPLPTKARKPRAAAKTRKAKAK